MFVFVLLVFFLRFFLIILDFFILDLYLGSVFEVVVDIIDNVNLLEFIYYKIS